MICVACRRVRCALCEGGAFSFIVTMSCDASVGADTEPDIIFISSESDDESIAVPNVNASTTTLTGNQKNTSSMENSSPPIHVNNSHVNENEKSVSQIQEIHLHIDHLFEKFVSTCTPFIQSVNDASEIIDVIKTRHAHSSSDFKSSARYRALLDRCIRKLSNNCNQEFVYINEVATVLRQHSRRKKRRISVTSCNTSSPNKNARVTASLDNSCRSGSDSEDPNKDDIASNLRNKIDRYEKLLKRFSDEIKRLQAHELSLDEMDQEDSIYIQEAKLKKKAIKVFEKLCAIKKVKPKTGRVTEQKISLSASRFPEINRKVESYVNRVRKFPDFYDIKYLVNRANEQHNLNLDQAIIQKTSEALFQEVGNHLQRTRQYDFVYNFGSYLTDPALEKEVSDPADSNPELLAKLQENRIKSKCALDDVIDKFSSQQEAEGTNHWSKDSASGIDSRQGSDPPSLVLFSQESSDGDNSDEEADQEDFLILSSENKSTVDDGEVPAK